MFIQGIPRLQNYVGVRATPKNQGSTLHPHPVFVAFTFTVLSPSVTTSLFAGVNPCLNLTCWTGSHCEINRLGIAECRCPEPTLCETSVRPVCGTDGFTYESVCQLEQISCPKKSDVRVAYDGRCGKTNSTKQRNLTIF